MKTRMSIGDKYGFKSLFVVEVFDKGWKAFSHGFPTMRQARENKRELYRIAQDHDKTIKKDDFRIRLYVRVE